MSEKQMVKTAINKLILSSIAFLLSPIAVVLVVAGFERLALITLALIMGLYSLAQGLGAFRNLLFWRAVSRQRR